MVLEIITWLTGDMDYDDGVNILRKYSSSSWIVNLLAKGPGPYNTTKLKTELEKLSLAAVPVIEPALEKQIPAPSEDPYSPDRDLEKKLRIDAILKQLWKEICHLHGRLWVLPEGKDLFNCSKLILEKNLKRQNLWDQLHYFNNNGVWFDELPENQPKPYDLEQQIKNLMASRSKARKELKKPLPDGKKGHVIKRIERFDQAIALLKSMRINGKKEKSSAS